MFKNNFRQGLAPKLSFLIGLLLSSHAGAVEERRAQDDFNLHMNAAWEAQAKIPPSKARIGSIPSAGEALNEKVDKLFGQLLAKSDWPEGSQEAAAVTLYKSWMDWSRRNELGLKPLEPTLKKIDSIKTAADLFDAKKPYDTLPLLVGVFSIDDDVAIYDDGTVVPSMSVGIPLLSQRDFAGEGSDQVKILESVALHAYQRLGDPDPKQAAADFMRLTREKAKYLLNDAEERDAHTTPSVITLEALEKRFPTLPLAALIKNLTDESYSGPLYYSKDKIFKAIDLLLVDTPVDELKRYLKGVQYIHHMKNLAREDYEAYYNLYVKPVRGVEALPDDAEEAKAFVGLYLPTTMGKLYEAEHFSPESRALFAEMVAGLKASLAERIQTLPWMSEATRTKALEKLEKTGVMIGQAKNPPRVDYNLLAGDEFFLTSHKIRVAHAKMKFELLGQHPKLDEYFMPVLYVNAFNDFSKNMVVFPFGILNKPFYDEATALKDKANAYGAIGVVIGHEITHGFDDQGSQFDLHGVKKDWWAEEDKEKFKALGQKMVSFYNKETYTISGKEYPVNGELTLGENIADLGGLAIAYDAYRKTDEFKKGEMLEGKTPTQRFFETYAKLWRSKVRPQVMLNLVRFNEHAPASVRINAPLKNMKVFQDAYEVKTGDGMYIAPEDRISIW